MSKKNLLVIGGAVMAMALMGQGCNFMGTTNTQVTPTPPPASPTPTPTTMPQPSTVPPSSPTPLPQPLAPATTVSKSSFAVTYTVGVSKCPMPIDLVTVYGVAGGTFKVVSKPSWIDVTGFTSTTNSGSLGTHVNLVFNCKVDDTKTDHTLTGKVVFEGFDKSGQSTGQVGVDVTAKVAIK